MMSENGMEAGVNGKTATSGYRVSMVSGGLELSARLSTLEELELLVKVLEANKALWRNTTNGNASEPLLLREAISQKPAMATPRAPKANGAPA
jgi:hypothetical protein